MTVHRTVVMVSCHFLPYPVTLAADEAFELQVTFLLTKTAMRICMDFFIFQVPEVSIEMASG